MNFATAFREPSAYERRLFDRLMDCECKGRDSLRVQLSNCCVRTYAKNGCLEINTESPWADVDARVPVEGTVKDADGFVIYYLLHVVNGKACTLEIYKEDGSPLSRRPDIESIEVWGS